MENKIDININVEYLSFDKNFNININKKSKVIFGVNGIGKSSIYASIMKNYKNFAYIDYEDMKSEFININNKEINVFPKINKAEKITIEIESECGLINIKDNLKSWSISNAKEAKKFSKDIQNLQSKKRIFENIRVGEVLFNKINSFTREEILFLARNLSKIKNIADLENEVLAAKQLFMKDILTSLLNNIDKNTRICPVCGNQVDDLMEIIKTKLNKIEEIRSEQINEYYNIYQGKPENMLEQFKNLQCLADEFNEKIFVDTICLDGDFSKKEKFNDSLRKISKLEKELNETNEEICESYNNLTTISSRYCDYLKHKFNATVKFNDEDNTVIISLPRAVRFYSTAELNIVLFVTKIYEYLGSDKEIMVLDDPISSYDIVNQYKIIYDIVSNNTENKRFLIFSHNLEIINIINSQNRDVFDYESLEKIDGKICIIPIRNESVNVVSIKNILSCTSSEECHDYVELCYLRENHAEKDQISKILHYDCKYVTKFENRTTEFSNEFLVEFIENFSLNYFNNKSYFEMCLLRIFTLISLRVWIEYKFYSANLENNKLMTKTLAKKIDHILPKNGKNLLVTEYPLLTRESLMGKKVMLNQNSHQESQFEPFHYALNISIDDIVQEVNEMKKLFSK